MVRRLLLLAALPAALMHAASPKAALSKALTFHAGFDGSTDASFGAGDRRIHTATSYEKREDAHAGLDAPGVALAKGEGKFGDALRFSVKNEKAVYYPAAKNVAYAKTNWSGTISFWLKLDPDKDLAPGYCDPLQLTDEAYNDGAFWVDFNIEKPRAVRLGSFGELSVWNPKKLEPDTNPNFNSRLVVVKQPPFGADRWTHIAFTFSGISNPGKTGKSKLYVNGELKGESTPITEPFEWNIERAAIRLGLNYTGLFDDVAAFNRELTAAEMHALYALKNGVKELHK